MREANKSLVAAFAQLLESRGLANTSKLSSSAPIQGVIFSSSVPGKKPMSSPTGTVARVTIISR